MKAIVYNKYGPVRDALDLREIDQPEPLEHQVLINVIATSVNALDYRRFEKLTGFGKFMERYVLKNIGKVLGADISGIVHSVGTNVSKFKIGDEVFGSTGTNLGGFAEFVNIDENTIALKPKEVSFEAGAGVAVAACTALQALRKKGQILPGETILINGASGGVGSFAIQLAKHMGASVTAVCSTENHEKALSMGADFVIDYRRFDFTKGTEKYDLILAISGFHSLFEYWRCLTSMGTYVAVGGDIRQIMQATVLGPIISLFSKRKIKFMGISRVNKNDLEFLAHLLGTGKIITLQDKSFPLSKIADAFEYVLKEHAKGKVIITI